jgi:hypothetical protein
MHARPSSARWFVASGVSFLVVAMFALGAFRLEILAEFTFATRKQGKFQLGVRYFG